MVWGTRRDPTACFACEQARLEVPSLDLRLVEARHGCCMWHDRAGPIKLKLKTEMLMHWVVSDPATLTLSFFSY
jgi:hypothetical protein